MGMHSHIYFIALDMAFSNAPYTEPVNEVLRAPNLFIPKERRDGCVHPKKSV